MPEAEWQTARPGDGNLRVPSVIGAGVEVPGVEWAQEDKDTGDIEPNICPGYAVRLPIVIECCQAQKAFEKGALDVLFPEISNSVADGVQELSRAFDEFMRQRMTEIQRRAERNG
jgi:hypothetical protein